MQLAPNERDIANLRAPLAGQKKYFLKRRALLRRLVALRIGCPPDDVVIAHDAHGAPRIVAPKTSLFVSVSARESFAGFAISNAPVGVDMELKTSPREPIWAILNAIERPAIEARWRIRHLDDLFIQTWIAKEAYLKALGTGLKRDPTTCAAIVSSTGSFEIRDDLRRETGLHDAQKIGDQLVYCACIALAQRVLS